MKYVTKYAELFIVWLLHRVTGDPKDSIFWELGWAKTNDHRMDIDGTIFAENDGELQGSGYSLLNFATGYLDWHAKLDGGWAPHQYQK